MDVVNQLFSAFHRLDHREMTACYTPDATFTDPVFDLQGAEIGKMWKMLCTGARDFALDHRVVEANREHAVVDWTATYRFAPTGRRVVNRIRSNLTIDGDLITAQQDTFDFYRWARRALGVPGLLLGWVKPFQARVRATARAGLRRAE